MRCARNIFLSVSICWLAVAVLAPPAAAQQPAQEKRIALVVGVLVAMLLLLTFMGDALRNALDTRISDAIRAGGNQ